MAKPLQMVLDATSVLGEGPVWLDDEKTILWVDILEKAIHLHTPHTGAHRTIRTDQYVGAAVPAGEGRLLCAMHHGFYFLDLRSERMEPIADPEAELPGNRFNDGKCDAAGRFWAGTMPISGRSHSGALYCLERDCTVRKALTGVSVSNGLGWSPDDTQMYYIDTPTKQIVRFAYHLRTGEIKDCQVAVEFPEDAGVPDGMTVDSEGMIWVAHWGGSCVTRWDPVSGVQLERIDLPVSQVTSCCFGGERLDELYITSARAGLTEKQLAEQPLAGGLFRVQPGVAGKSANRFGHSRFISS